VLHFLRTGASAGANPHPLFDTIYYCREYPDIAGSGSNPLIHFIEHGGVEGRNPHPFFNMAAYLAANPDVDESGVNPLLHFVSSGANEGRAIRRVAAPAPSTALSKSVPVSSGRLITNLRMESLRRKLAIALMQVERLKRGAKSAGKLLSCTDPFYQGRIYYCLEGKRHWVVPNSPNDPGDPSDGHMDCYGLSLGDLSVVEREVMRQYTLAGPLPLLWPDEFWEDPVRSCPFDLREISTSQLRGSGIEFGAGTEPMSVPLACEVKYADLFSQQDLHARAYTAQGADFVPLTYVMGMEDMSAVADASLDFVIARHVIEHLRNPLRAFEQVYRKLKPGGQYVLIVPDQRLMFDRDRALTTLEHLVEDFEDPNTERDVQHYWEFFRKVYKFEGEELDQRVHEAISGNLDLHFHTWTYESFGDMVKRTQRTNAPWRSVWSQPAIWEDPGSQEFYFVVGK